MDTPPRPPLALLLAGWLTVAIAIFFVVLALLSLGGGHGAFSGNVALGLLAWALVVAAAGIAMLRRAWWSRGPVVAAGLLHLLAFGQSTLVAPWAALPAAAALVAVVGAVLPVTRSALRRGGGA